jgi:phospholipid transport system substrate-binding protein
MRKAAWFMALIFCSLLMGRAVLAADSPMEVLKKANKKIEKLLDKKVSKGSEEEKKRDEKIKKVVDGFLDFKTLAKRSMGKHWNERTDEEQKEFSKVFRELLQKNYLKQIHEKSDYEMIYDSEEIEENKAVVNTTIKAKNKKGEEAETSVVYKLRKSKNKWLVIDIETDEVSLVQNYRSQFNKIIKKDSYEVLIDKIRKKIEEDSDPDEID